jgi:hypothetical protein
MPLTNGERVRLLEQFYGLALAWGCEDSDMILPQDKMHDVAQRFPVIDNDVWRSALRSDPLRPGKRIRMACTVFR